MPIDNNSILSAFSNLTKKLSSFENPLTTSLVITLAIIITFVYIFYGIDVNIERKKMITMAISIFCIVFVGLFINNMLITKPKSPEALQSAIKYMNDKTEPSYFVGGQQRREENINDNHNSESAYHRP